MAMTRATIALAATAWLAVAPVGLGQAPAGKAALARADFRAAMADAHALRQQLATMADPGRREDAERAFGRLIVSCRASFPEVPAAPGDRARYGRINLNARGGGVDAVRFRVPTAGRTYALYWSSILFEEKDATNLATVNILPVEGDDLMLTYAENLEDVSVAGRDLPRPNWWFQYRLSGRKLDAGREYILWYGFKADRPMPVDLKLRIEPLETAEPPTTPALQAARASFESAVEALDRRFDDETKAARRKYLDELDRAGRAAAKKAAAGRRESLAEADRVNLGDSDAGDPRGFRVLRAEIGVGEQWNDVTVPIRTQIRGDRLAFDPGALDFKPDAAYATAKTLIIVYTIDGKPGIYTAPADRKVDLPPPGKK